MKRIPEATNIRRFRNSEGVCKKGRYALFYFTLHSEER